MKSKKISYSLNRRDFLKKSAGGAFLLGFGATSLESLLNLNDKPVSNEKTHNVVRLCFNENPLGPSPLALELLKKGDLPYNQYTNPGELESELARFHKLKPENILVGVGSSEILRIAPMAFALNKGNVITALQAYKTLGRYADKIGIKVKWIPLNKSYLHDLEAMKKAIDKNTSLVNICNPNNPTGTVLPYEELKNFIESMSEQIVTFVDEAYYHYIEDKEYPSFIELINSGKKVIISRTFSKAYGMAGLRVGYAVASADIIKQMRSFSSRATGMNIAGLEAARASLKDLEHIKKSVELAKKGREFFYKGFYDMDLTYVKSQTPFLAVNVMRDCSEVVKALKKHKILVREGRDWQMPNFIRISMGLMEENKICLEALKKVLA